jgi:hypothetical protein
MQLINIEQASIGDTISVAQRIRALGLLLAVSLLPLLSVSTSRAQNNVGIGTTAPNSSALLEMVATDKGLLIPRVTTAQKNAIASPATGLLVFDQSLTQFYYYTGVAWVPFINNSTGWSTLGNAGTVASTNFLGTTDAIDFRIRTNNIERMTFTSGGNIGIGTTTPGRPFEVVMDAPANTTTATFRSVTAGYGVHIGGLGSNSTYGVLQGYGPGNTAAPLVFQSTLSNGKLGVSTVSPNTLLDINGDFAMRQTGYTASSGSNNDISVGATSFIRVTGPGAAFTITGIAGGVDGKVLVIYNATTQNMSITNNDGLSSAANRVYTLAGTVSTTGTGCISLIYSATDSRWIVTAVNQ